MKTLIFCHFERKEKKRKLTTEKTLDDKEPWLILKALNPKKMPTLICNNLLYHTMRRKRGFEKTHKLEFNIEIGKVEFFWEFLFWVNFDTMTEKKRRKKNCCLINAKAFFLFFFFWVRKNGHKSPYFDQNTPESSIFFRL
jgi:hypothetical protein